MSMFFLENLKNVIKNCKTCLRKCIRKIGKDWLVPVHTTISNSSCAFLTDDVINKLRQPCSLAKHTMNKSIETIYQIRDKYTN